MQNTVQWVESAYDQIAGGYDERWSVHLGAPQQRLTQSLGLSPGLRCADLGCGTGVHTLEMAELVAPGEVVAVDSSEGMLEQARRRAQARGCTLSTVCADAERFIERGEPATFDIVTLRFCLAYLSWRDVVPALARVLRRSGRVGILTNVGTSAPQAHAVYRSMVRELGVLDVSLPVPASPLDLACELERAGFRGAPPWTHRFQLCFESGVQVARWLRESGFVTHPALSAAPQAVQRALWAAFAARIEAYRGSQGIPLDFEVAGIVAALR